jgi:tRNA(Arg) A34 adenosine deaminase TadA
MNHNKFILEAVQIANQNVSLGGGPFGAVIVRNGEIIASSANSVTSDNDPTAHAEVNVIRKACKLLNTYDLSGCVIYSSCEPCPMCLGAIYWAHLDELYFAADKNDADKAGFSDAFIYNEIDKPIYHRKIKTVQIQIKEYNEPFENWKSTENKIEY